jgi:hypothetical protein
VLDAAQQAIDHTRQHLFPFRFERWLALGFVAFLDQCGRSGGGFPGGTSDGDDWNGGGQGIGEAAEWVSAHVGLVMVVAAVVLLVVLVVVALVLWLNSRGVFMYLDNVATGRADVSRPWREHAGRANSYFAWSFGLAIVTLVGVLVLLVPTVLVALRLARGNVRAGPIVALALLLMAFAVLILGASLASLLLRDFVAPIQWQRQVACGQAVETLFELIRVEPVAFVVFVALKIVFSLALAIVALFVGCLTCCCGFLPVVQQTVLQPALYFERAWSLHLLRQLGFELIATPAPRP